MDYWLLLLGIVLGYLVTVVYELAHVMLGKILKEKPIVKIKDYHLHHSLYGLGMFVLFFFFTYAIILGSGIGIILRHTHSEKKFTFIDKC